MKNRTVKQNLKVVLMMVVVMIAAALALALAAAAAAAVVVVVVVYVHNGVVKIPLSIVSVSRIIPKVVYGFG